MTITSSQKIKSKSQLDSRLTQLGTHRSLKKDNFDNRKTITQKWPDEASGKSRKLLWRILFMCSYLLNVQTFLSHWAQQLPGAPHSLGEPRWSPRSPNSHPVPPLHISDLVVTDVSGGRGENGARLQSSLRAPVAGSQTGATPDNCISSCGDSKTCSAAWQTAKYLSHASSQHTSLPWAQRLNPGSRSKRSGLSSQRQVSEPVGLFKAFSFQWLVPCNLSPCQFGSSSRTLSKKQLFGNGSSLNLKLNMTITRIYRTSTNERLFVDCLALN